MPSNNARLIKRKPNEKSSTKHHCSSLGIMDCRSCFHAATGIKSVKHYLSPSIEGLGGNFAKSIDGL